MKFFLGIDGGGTKTAYLLVDENGNPCAELSDVGSFYLQHGMQTVADRLAVNTKRCLETAGASQGDLKGVYMGLPLVGENDREDRNLVQILDRNYPYPYKLVNDAEVAFAGSLGGESGINVVAGTGSIAFGRDESGQTSRSGGWSDRFGDEGSCYWIAHKAMSLFTKEADGREGRSALYDIVRKEYSINNDFEFVEIMEKEYLPYRDKTASFQRVLLEAAKAGDPAAIMLYRDAAKELSSMAVAIKRRLSFTSETINVSYSGGIFHAGDFIVSPFEALLKKESMQLVKPVFSPVEGAAIMARKEFTNKF